MPRSDLNRKQEWVPSPLPPAFFKSLISFPARRVATLEAKQKPSTPQSPGRIQQDQVIAERLARLRQQNKPSEWEQTG